jgi:hypothetical protein
MVRKGGLEPPCLTAPPPQDGVSANSTTSALHNLVVVKHFATSDSRLSPTATDLTACDRSLPGPRLHGIVSSNVLQRKAVGVVSVLRQKGMTAVPNAAVDDVPCHGTAPSRRTDGWVRPGQVSAPMVPAVQSTYCPSFSFQSRRFGTVNPAPV